MGRIQLLTETVASQVAAGEVIERPASLVKELVENSMDAHATHIEVLIRGGGAHLVRVTDNGHGMDRDDALLSLERHATSKLRTGADLAAIATLGFRGEALPSIASVTRFRLSTRPPGALAGTEILVNGGKLESVRDSGDAPGTQIEARSLFYNLPARRKFLRSEDTEAAHIEHQLRLHAIARPDIGFTFIRNDRTILQLPPAEDLRHRLHDLLGAPALENLLPIALQPSAHGFHGFISRPGHTRSSRSDQLTFVNGRPVENLALSQGLREGYHTALMRGQHPVTFLFLDLDPALVDVNVHPAKREVRFRYPAELRATLARLVRQTLETTHRPAWSATLRGQPQPVPSDQAALPAEPSAQTTLPLPSSSDKITSPPAPRPFPQPTPEELAADWTLLPRIPVPPTQPSPSPAQQSAFSAQPAPFPAQPAALPADFRLIGVLHKLYILLESPEGLVLVDQHAAHERILFEQVRDAMEKDGVPAQSLLLPLTLDLSPRDAHWLRENLSAFRRAGLGLEDFGPHTFKLDSLPSFVNASDPLQFVRDALDELRSAPAETVSNWRLGEDLIAKTVCRMAVKANDTLREPEQRRLLSDLLACQLPYCCPHGRPTLIRINLHELEQKFGRIQK